jgi:4-hydroxy-4-methyl-2-oxoglutarate aldolase
MIEDPPLLTIRRKFPRPPAAIVAALAGTPTGYLIDAMGGRGALDHTIKPLPGVPAAMTRLSGVAVTCLAGPSDNLAVFAAIQVARPGDIIVCACDRFSAAAVTGDLLLGMAKNRGIAGFVTDGMVRDLEGIIGVGLPVFCSGLTPNSPARNGPGLVGVPVQLGGLQVDSGDLVVGDQDGIVIVPRAQLKQVQTKLADVRAAEAALEAKVRGGLEVPDFVQQLLDSGRVRYLD